MRSCSLMSGVNSSDLAEITSLFSQRMIGVCHNSPPHSWQYKRPKKNVKIDILTASSLCKHLSCKRSCIYSESPWSSPSPDVAIFHFIPSHYLKDLGATKASSCLDFNASYNVCVLRRSLWNFLFESGVSQKISSFIRIYNCFFKKITV